MHTEVGKHYMVKCALYRLGHFGNNVKIWLPILGERHADPEIANPKHHYHLDVRFIPNLVLRRLWGGEFDPRRILVMGCEIDLPPTKIRRLRCVRQFIPIHPPGFICEEINGISFEKFEKLMASSQVIAKDGCKFCPHKGTPLDCAPTIGVDNQVECPGHGLTWDLISLRLIERNRC